MVEWFILVVGYIGLCFQVVLVDGGYKVKGCMDVECQCVIDEVCVMVDVGVFVIVIEGVVEDLVDEIIQVVDVFMIGIGVLLVCDGQILVIQDMFGVFEWIFKFVKRYDNMVEWIDVVVVWYVEEVCLWVFLFSVEVYIFKCKDG